MNAIANMRNPQHRHSNKCVGCQACGACYVDKRPIFSEGWIYWECCGKQWRWRKGSSKPTEVI